MPIVLGMNDKTVGTRVAKARSVAGVSGRELSALAGLSPAMVWQIEQGIIVNPGMETLRGLSRVLGVSVDWLVNGGDISAETVRESVAAARASNTPTAA